MDYERKDSLRLTLGFVVGSVVHTLRCAAAVDDAPRGLATHTHTFLTMNGDGN